jgi:hypothetical protein
MAALAGSGHSPARESARSAASFSVWNSNSATVEQFEHGAPIANGLIRHLALGDFLQRGAHNGQQVVRRVGLGQVVPGPGRDTLGDFAR